MGEMEPEVLSFNLWDEKWITLEQSGGPPVRVSLEQALTEAHRFSAIYDSSPLVVVGVHRLLIAILQAVLDLQTQRDVAALWKAGRFPPHQVKSFGSRYAHRFDLFSEDQPFMQSGDLPLKPAKGDPVKTVAYLTPDAPAGTAVIHYRHILEADQALCPVCAALGLVLIPAFATSGGAGIKPSINGVPPIYILPGGDNLFQSLTASLIPKSGMAYRPAAANPEKDMPWWERTARVARSEEVFDVGYLQSLTFPARRVRLHPTESNKICTRCGEHYPVMVRTMVFEMGESRPKDSAPWLDPFAAYSLDLKGSKPPIPLRPQEGKVLWREFSTLFLPQTRVEDKNRRYVRPAILDQIANEDSFIDRTFYPFRCIGLRTDMKAKIFEWIDADFSVPGSLLNDEEAGRLVREATQFAKSGEDAIRISFQSMTRGSSKKSQRFEDLLRRMMADYWSVLAEPFRRYVIDLAQPGEEQSARKRWADQVYQVGMRVFRQAAENIGDDAEALQRQITGIENCGRQLGGRRKKYLQQGEAV